MDFHAFEREGWQDANVCERYHDDLGAVTAQSVAALLEAAEVRASQRVLDMATGPGYAAGRAGELGALAVGADFSLPQLRLARQAVVAQGWVACDAGNLPFAPASFDAVINNYGMPHFPDPARAMAESARVLRPGGRFAFSVWDSPDKVLGFGVIYDAVRRHGRMDVGLPPGPNFFEFSDAARCAEALTRAGLADVRVVGVPQTWRVATPTDLLRAVMTGTVRAAALLRAQTAPALSAIEAHVWAMLEACAVPGGYAVPMPAVVASAVKP